MPLKLLLTFALLAVVSSVKSAPIRVACVGDSITQGVGIADPAKHGYPALLGRILGRDYEVRNFGSSGTTLLEDGNNPYRSSAAFRGATQFKPQIVIIALGTNDSKTVNWDGHEAQFRPDYENLVKHFAKLNAETRVFVCLPPPCFKTGGDDIREAILVRQRELIRQAAAASKLPVIDLNAPLAAHPDWLPDGVHPNESGARAIAETVAAALRK